MLSAVGTLLKRHLVLFVVLRDEELEALRRRRAGRARRRQPRGHRRRAAARAAAGADPPAPSRRPCRSRRAAAEAGPALVNAYLDFKRQEPAVNALADSRRFRAAREGEWRRLEDILDRCREARRCARSTTRICSRCRSSIAAPSPRSRSRARPRSISSCHLSRGAVRARLFLRLRRADLGPAAGSAPSSRHDWPAAVREPVARDAGRARCSPSIGAARRLSARRRRSRAGSTPSSRRSSPAAAISPPPPSICAATLYDDAGDGGLSVFATFLFTHNSQVAIIVLRARLRLRRADR